MGLIAAGRADNYTLGGSMSGDGLRVHVGPIPRGCHFFSNWQRLMVEHTVLGNDADVRLRRTGGEMTYLCAFRQVVINWWCKVKGAVRAKRSGQCGRRWDANCVSGGRGRRTNVS
jgi:hypothetical protein